VFIPRTAQHEAAEMRFREVNAQICFFAIKSISLTSERYATQATRAAHMYDRPVVDVHAVRLRCVPRSYFNMDRDLIFRDSHLYNVVNPMV
jgi:hypothetical protein